MGIGGVASVAGADVAGAGMGRGAGLTGMGRESAISETSMASGIGAGLGLSGRLDAAMMPTIASPTTPCATTEPAAGACLRQPAQLAQWRIRSRSSIARDYARARC